MTAFPTLKPSSRTFTPGSYPHSTFTGMSGVQGRVRNSNVMLSSQVRLTFAAINEMQMLSILAHYQARIGSFQGFLLPAELWSGVSDAADYQLAGYGWQYVEPPTVTDAMCADAYDVELTLESVPPEGTALLGLNSSVQFRITGGTAQAAAGTNLTVTASIEYGASAAAGLAETVNVTLTGGAFTSSGAAAGAGLLVPCTILSGVATGGASDGLAITVNWTLLGGTAVGAGSDPSFASVALLLHMDGNDGSQSIIDSSSSAKSPSVVNGSLTTSRFKFGTASLAGIAPASPVVAWTNAYSGSITGVFTIESWLYRPSGQGVIGIYRFGNEAPGRSNFYYRSDNRIELERFGTGVSVTTSVAVPLNEFFHFAVTWNANNSMTLWINGVGSGSFNNPNAIGNSGRLELYAGSNHNIDETRLTLGVARYTGNFTPPTAAFPDS